MNKIDWKAKLTSRKFWAAIIGFVGAIMTAFAVPAATASQVTAIIMAFATLIAYIIGEGLVDAANAGSSTTTNIVSPYTGSAVGTVSNTSAATTTATGTAEDSQTQQVTGGLGVDVK